jgi:NDP-sugar pyrophosphorylase family protein
MVSINNLFDLKHSIAGAYLSSFHYPWETLRGILDLIIELGEQLNPVEYFFAGKDIWIHKSAVVAESAQISGPCIVGPETEIRHCAFIRGSALIGRNCVIGNSVELKNVILFDNVQVPHFNYIGDSVLGYRSHTGAGAITSNVKSDKTLVTVKGEGGEAIPTGLKKFGAMLGDYVEVGCNSVLNPGTVIGRNTNIYPLSSVRGTVPPNSIFKGQGNIVEKK